MRPSIRRLPRPGAQLRWSSRATRPSRANAQATGTPFYVVPMFPYPSGSLHLGHLRVYTISDVLARFKRMQGFRVVHPVGWDAFGLPAENAALERGEHPKEWTQRNIEAMKAQMELMGGEWSWECELRTCDPAFYKHTQRLFLMLHARGLAYQAESLVNWDPVDRTVLANEQVDANGRSWRSGAVVEQKRLKQWFLNIKAFQEPLLNDLDALQGPERWPERVLAMQRNWIGRSVGTKLSFDLHPAHPAPSSPPPASVDVFTTRADTLTGAMYLALSLNHPLVQALSEDDAELRDFLDRAKAFPPNTKEGFRLKRVHATNPLAGLFSDKHLAEPLPVYVAPYVLDGYGSGAVMGVPAHDARDHAFWRHNQKDLPIVHAITPEPSTDPGPTTSPMDGLEKPVLEKGYVASSDPRLRGLASDDAVEVIIAQLQEAGKPVERTENWRLRDWLVSRQRYWGTPIPIVHCGACGSVPVPEKDLPVELPDLPASAFQGKPGNPLAQDKNWKKTTCPSCGGPAERETDTMDTFMDSSWYFFRFLDPENRDELIQPAIADSSMPVDVYIGGVEHAILHLLYARFISKFLATTDVWPRGREVSGEPFRRLITQGMVHGKTYCDPETGRFLPASEVDLGNFLGPVIKGTEIAPKISYEKMSKSKHNGVDPGATIAKYGADATRAQMLFLAPISDVVEWDESKIKGVQRWLHRVEKLSTVFWWPEVELKGFKAPHNLNIGIVPLLKSLHSSEKLKESQQWKQMREDLKSQSKNPVEPYDLDPKDATFLIKVHQTIARVTKSYAETLALNTIVSDLMTLTNTIWDTPHTTGCTGVFKWYATTQLLRMLAPIAPSVAQTCWNSLHARTNAHIQNDSAHPLRAYTLEDPKAGMSIFDLGFPQADTDVLPLLNLTMNCVVQIDGTRRFEARIAPVPAYVCDAGAHAVETHIMEELLQSPEAQRYLKPLVKWAVGKKEELPWPMSAEEFLESAKAVIHVVRGGQLINIVRRDSKKGYKRELKKANKPEQKKTEEPQWSAPTGTKPPRDVLSSPTNPTVPFLRKKYLKDDEPLVRKESVVGTPAGPPVDPFLPVVRKIYGNGRNPPIPKQHPGKRVKQPATPSTPVRRTYMDSGPLIRRLLVGKVEEQPDGQPHPSPGGNPPIRKYEADYAAGLTADGPGVRRFGEGSPHGRLGPAPPHGTKVGGE